MTSASRTIAVMGGGMPNLAAREDSGPSIKPMIRAETIGSRSGRANSSAATNMIRKIPIVAAWAVARQEILNGSATGLGGLGRNARFRGPFWRPQNPPFAARGH